MPVRLIQSKTTKNYVVFKEEVDPEVGDIFPENMAIYLSKDALEEATGEREPKAVDIIIQAV